MIWLNKQVVDQNSFPDGTLLLKNTVNESGFYSVYNMITWKFENNAELWTLIALTKHLKSKGVRVSLSMPYVPNARMDRTKKTDDVFTLKYFSEIINSLGFKRVFILDPHSNVTPALIERCTVEDPRDYIECTIIDIAEKCNVNRYDIILYYPDAGAVKRYSDIIRGYKYVIGNKKRDWNTGMITGLDVITNGVDLTGKTVLMIDDICSYGGTFKFSAEKLKELGADKIYAYATHTENSVLDKEKGTFIKCLENGTVEKLYTTNSLYSGENDDIISFDAIGFAGSLSDDAE